MDSYGVEVVWDQDDDRNNTRTSNRNNGGDRGNRWSINNNNNRGRTTITNSNQQKSASLEESFDDDAIEQVFDSSTNGTKVNTNRGSSRYYSTNLRKKAQDVYNSHRASSNRNKNSAAVPPRSTPKVEVQGQPMQQQQDQQSQQAQQAWKQYPSVSTSAAGAHVYEEGWASFEDNDNVFKSSPSNAGSGSRDHVIHYKIRDQQLADTSGRRHHDQGYGHGFGHRHGHASAAVNDSWADTSTIDTHPFSGGSSTDDGNSTPDSSFAVHLPIVDWNASNGDRLNDYIDEEEHPDDEETSTADVAAAGRRSKNDDRSRPSRSRSRHQRNDDDEDSEAGRRHRSKGRSSAALVAAAASAVAAKAAAAAAAKKMKDEQKKKQKENEQKKKLKEKEKLVKQKEKELLRKEKEIEQLMKQKEIEQLRKEKEIEQLMKQKEIEKLRKQKENEQKIKQKKHNDKESKKKPANVVVIDKKAMLSEEDQEEKRRYRHRLCFIFSVGCLLMSIVWFLVYYFTAGKEKWTIGRNRAATTSAPTISPAPTTTFAPSAAPSRSPTKAPTVAPTTATPTITPPTPTPPTTAPTPATNEPTEQPTKSPTNRPTAPPPTNPPTQPPTTLSEANDVQVLVNGAAADLRAIIEDNPLLGPKFVRLGFHDCVGFCDGCVDMSFIDNLGLDVPIEALEPITAKYERLDLGFTRADIWALSALVAADYHQEQNEEFEESDRVNFQMQFIGRQNCEDRFNNRCFGEDGVTQRECSAMAGPFHHLPMANTKTHDLFAFFAEEFGFSDRETVALMGAHTLGRLARENSGIEAPNGWVRDNNLLDNEYYFELVGGNETSPLEDLIELAPPWLRVLEDNSDNPPFPDMALWEAFPPNTTDPTQTERIVMLNIDIALVRELSDDNMDEFGRVSCSFTNTIGGGTVPRCPHAERSIGIAAEYLFDNELWLNDFMHVYHKMLNHGCTDAIFCNGGLCECTL